MHRIIENDLQAFHNHPFYLVLILIWAGWYVSFQRREARSATNAAQRQGHQRRAVVGVLTALVGIFLYDSMMGQTLTQQTKVELHGDSTPVPIDPIQAKSEDYIYALLAQFKDEPDKRDQFMQILSGYKETERMGIMDFADLKTRVKTAPSDSIGALEIYKSVPYAAHGYIFPRPPLRALFQQCNWYKPTQSDIATVEKTFNPNEKSNVAGLNKLQREIVDGKI